MSTIRDPLPALPFPELPCVVLPGATAPVRRLDSDGIDLFPRLQGFIPTGAQQRIPCGVCFAIPVGWVGLLLDRSSWASRGLGRLGGVIDANFRGEVEAIMRAHGEPIMFRPDRAIVQMVVVPVFRGPLSFVSELPTSVRGTAGFGSTDRG